MCEQRAVSSHRLWRVAAGLACALLLVACHRVPQVAQPPSRGSRLYTAHCLSCHQAQGQGVSGIQPPLAGTPVPNGDPEVLLAWVMVGVRPTVLPAGHYAGVMPQFNYLSDADLAAILSYVRSSFGNQSSVITVEQVASVRSRQAAR